MQCAVLLGALDHFMTAPGQALAAAHQQCRGETRSRSGQPEIDADDAGLYGAVVPQVPAIVAACPRGHLWRDDLAACLRGRPALLIEDELATLPHLIGLIAPAVVVAPVGADATLDEALRIALSSGNVDTRGIGLLARHAEPPQEWTQIA